MLKYSFDNFAIIISESRCQNQERTYSACDPNSNYITYQSKDNMKWIEEYFAIGDWICHEVQGLSSVYEEKQNQCTEYMFDKVSSLSCKHNSS